MPHEVDCPMTGVSPTEQGALQVLGLDKPPHSGLGLISWDIRWANPVYIDWLLLDILVSFAPDGVHVSELAEQTGLDGRRVAGRMRSLRHHGFVKPVEDGESILYDSPKPTGQAWALTAKALRKAAPKRLKTYRLRKGGKLVTR